MMAVALAVATFIAPPGVCLGTMLNKDECCSKLSDAAVEQCSSAHDGQSCCGSVEKSAEHDGLPATTDGEGECFLCFWTSTTPFNKSHDSVGFSPVMVAVPVALPELVALSQASPGSYAGQDETAGARSPGIRRGSSILRI